MSFLYRFIKKATDESSLTFQGVSVTLDTGTLTVTAGDVDVTAGHVTAGAHIDAGTYVTAASYVSAGSYVDAASYVEFGVSGARLYTGIVTPTDPGFDAPNGSLYMYITTAAATAYLKTSTATTGWSSINVT